MRGEGLCEAPIDDGYQNFELKMEHDTNIHNDLIKQDDICKSHGGMLLGPTL